MPKYKLYHFNSLTSTQDKAREFSKKGFNNIIIVAKVQTRGRGRFKRKWHSGKGGLWMSILLKPKNIENLKYLTFAASVAVVESINKTARLKTNIKWPNDVHYKCRKLCGILTEGIFGKRNYVAVGIGLNANQTAFPDEIKDAATSLRIIKHRFFDVKKIMRSIADRFFSLYEGYYVKDKPKKILKIWKSYCDTIGKEVTVTARAGTLRGKVLKVDKDCSLLLKLKNNDVIKIIEGDINVRY